MLQPGLGYFVRNLRIKLHLQDAPENTATWGSLLIEERCDVEEGQLGIEAAALVASGNRMRLWAMLLPDSVEIRDLTS